MKKIIVLFVFITSFFGLYSNNLTISNTTLTDKNTTDHYTMIQFDIAWDNSWRTSSGPSNWDAAWVFVKFRKKGTTDWLHASLNWEDGTGTGDGHTVPAGAVIKGDIDTQDGNSLGVFIYSSSNMPQGNVNYTGAKLRWDYGIDGLLDDDLVEICVFGIEMVYVPQGAFQVGNTSPTRAFYTYPTDPSTYTISNENEITVGTTNGNLYYLQDGDQAGPIPANFPKGYNAFYCMKYEITQQQYVEFLLKLTSTQASARAYTAGGNRNGITGGFGTYTTSNPYVACNYLSWADLAAYLDWAALRPMTELEFEKACRGTIPAVQNEHVWGTTTVASNNSYTLSNAGTASESIATNYNIASGNIMWGGTNGGINGPTRVGIFASHPGNSGRVTAGATYYGIMEMGGNVQEQIVAVSNTTGRAFRNFTGDGILTANGDHNVTTWPAADATGMGTKGGGYSILNSNAIYISDRSTTDVGISTRLATVGGRGVRRAP